MVVLVLVLVMSLMVVVVVIVLVVMVIVPPSFCPNKGLSKHGNPVFPHFWSFFGVSIQ